MMASRWMCAGCGRMTSRSRATLRRSVPCIATAERSRLRCAPLNHPIIRARLILGDDVGLLASGGAWRQTNGTLVGGKRRQDQPACRSPQLGLRDRRQRRAGGVRRRTARRVARLPLATTRLEIATGSVWAQAQRIDPLAPAGPLNPPFPPKSAGSSGSAGVRSDDERSDAQRSAAHRHVARSRNMVSATSRCRRAGRSFHRSRQMRSSCATAATSTCASARSMLGDATACARVGGTVADFGTVDTVAGD